MLSVLPSRPLLRVAGAILFQRRRPAPFHAAAQAYAHRIEASRQGRVREPESAFGGAQSSQPSGRSLIRSFAGGQAVNGGTHRPEPQVAPMEVEVKIRLPDRAAYDKVAAALSAASSSSDISPAAPGADISSSSAGGRIASHAQANYFFDGPARELNSRKVVLRLRTYNGDEKATVTLKGRQILENGIGRASEVECEVPPAAAARYLAAPSDMLREVDIVRTAADKFGLNSLVGLGGFRNQRDCFRWRGHTLELDETAFEHGTLYEIECETDRPEELRDQLEAFLRQLGVSYSYSGTSKFANFINKSLL
ncbi:hypothetical protein Agub_g7398 [Astrephomene gubernaculifera]|uniref:CYTH domain-containing protein n=1 Tax=Astrephomene gubernaculifera TaxID=47775 RepID=A0AAD3HME3_9CHLO|nr:hypothetical protein Agub_g7398 [Astrephomene gubernaculifera]